MSTTLDRVLRGTPFVIESISCVRVREMLLRFGLTTGCHAYCVQQLFGGPVVVRFGRQEIALSRALARRVFVASLAPECAS